MKHGGLCYYYNPLCLPAFRGSTHGSQHHGGDRTPPVDGGITEEYWAVSRLDPGAVQRSHSFNTTGLSNQQQPNTTQAQHTGQCGVMGLTQRN